MQSPPPPPPPPPHHPMHQPSREDGGQTAEKPRSTALVLCMNVTHNISQICLGGVIFSALVIANVMPYSDSLSQHIILCTVGYFILMAQAVLAFSPFGWAANLKYENKRIIHLSMQILGSVLAITGSIIRLAAGSSNFNTNHGICGFVAMIMASVSLVGGLLSIVFPKQLSTKLMKIIHSCVGSVTLVLAFVTIMIAFHDYYRTILGSKNADTALALSVIALVGTLLMALGKNVQRILNK